MKKFFQRLKYLTYVIIMLGGYCVLTHAGELKDAKAAGQIQERGDGYVKATKESPEPHIAALVVRTNEKRQKKYEEIAASNNTAIEAVIAEAAAALK